MTDSEYKGNTYAIKINSDPIYRYKALSAYKKYQKTTCIQVVTFSFVLFFNNKILCACIGNKNITAISGKQIL